MFSKDELQKFSDMSVEFQGMGLFEDETLKEIEEEAEAIIESMEDNQYVTEDGHIKMDCPVCEASEHPDTIEENGGMCEVCTRESVTIKLHKDEAGALLESIDADIERHSHLDDEGYQAVAERLRGIKDKIETALEVV